MPFVYGYNRDGHGFLGSGACPRCLATPACVSGSSVVAVNGLAAAKPARQAERWQAQACQHQAGRLQGCHLHVNADAAVWLASGEADLLRCYETALTTTPA
ncbi:MAG: hypothetical protein ACRELF_09175 [Gemmataceae bacterium]